MKDNCLPIKLLIIVTPLVIQRYYIMIDWFLRKIGTLSLKKKFSFLPIGLILGLNTDKEKYKLKTLKINGIGKLLLKLFVKIIKAALVTCVSEQRRLSLTNV